LHVYHDKEGSKTDQEQIHHNTLGKKLSSIGGAQETGFICTMYQKIVFGLHQFEKKAKGGESPAWKQLNVSSILPSGQNVYVFVLFLLLPFSPFPGFHEHRGGKPSEKKGTGKGWKKKQ